MYIFSSIFLTNVFDFFELGKTKQNETKLMSHNYVCITITLHCP